MPITADILAQLKKLQGQPTTSESPSPFLKVPNSDLMSRVTRGAGPGLPSDAPMSGLPDAVASAPMEQRQPSVRLGSLNTGALGNVEARQQAMSEGLPSSQIRNGEILPPKQHHGFWDRLKQAGEGAVISMGRQAEQNARSGREQSLESLLGAGAAGGVVGGVSPLTIDAFKNQAQAERDVNQLGQEQGLEGQRAQIEAMKQKPLLDVQRLILEQQRADEAAKRADETNAIRRDANDIQRNRQPAQRQPLIKERTKSDGSKVSMISNDNGTTWKEVPELGSEAPVTTRGEETPEQRAARERKAGAARNELTSLIAAEEQARVRKQQLSDNLAQVKATGGDDPDLQKQVDAAQKEYAGYAEKKRKAQAEVDQFGGAGASSGASGTMRPSKDGKYHYTIDQIKAAAGANFESVYAKLKANPKVVID